MSLLIKNGTIIDGTGSERYTADLLIHDDRILKIGKDLPQNGAKIVDASYKVVAPGLIDMHHHGDLTIMKVNKAEATLMQGVTTLVVSVCGIGIAPANEKVRKYYDDFVAKAFGEGDMTLYDTFPDCFSALQEKGISSNLAFMIPQGNVRACVLGTEDRDPTPDELNEMKALVRKAMEAGAFGLSTGLIYPPGLITPTKELIELCKVVSKYGGIYDSHMRNEGTGVISEGMTELKEICQKAEVQGQISHWKAGSNFAWKLTPDMIEFVRQARNEGLILYSDMYPYEEGSTSLTGALLRPWVYENFQENLTNPQTRQRVVDETVDMFFETFLSDLPWYVRLIPKFIMKRLLFFVAKKAVRIISVVHNHHIEGLKLGEALDILYPGEKFTDALLNFMRDEEGSIMVSMKQMSEEKSILELIQQEFVAIGSDGFLVEKGNTHPRSYGCFPKILGNYCREKDLFSLEEAIQRMTGLPAEILSLKDRGVLKEHKKADLVIFDADTVIDTSTYENGRQFPNGIDYVIVNGEITVEEGKHLGILNGEILKREKS